MTGQQRSVPAVTPLRLVANRGERVPPNNAAAEQGLLGAIFVDNRAFHRVAGLLRAEHFYWAVHARIFQAVKRLIGTGTTANPATLKQFFDSDGALKDIGGARYLARLARSAVTVSNAEGYAGIIIDLATRRALIATSEDTLDAAYVVELDRSTRDIMAQHQSRLDHIRASGMRARLAPLDLVRFLALDVPAIEMLMTPWLRSKGLVMIYAPRGLGKTLLALSSAYAIATGTGLLRWDAPRPRRVLYVDGEMPVRIMQQRLNAAEAARDTQPKPGYFRMLSGDATPEGLPDLCTPEGQAELDAVIGDAEVIFLDNLSTLVRSARENEGDDWVNFQGWLLKQRRDGRSVVMIHHAGKAGLQRGTSRREDVLDTVVSLRRPDGYSADQGARFIVELDKARGVWGDDARPFLAQYQEDRDGAALWTHQEVDPLRRVAELASEGMSIRAIERKTDISRSEVQRLRKEAITRGLYTPS